MDLATILPKLTAADGTSQSNGGDLEIALCSIFVFLASIVVIVGLAGNSIIIAAIMRERRLHTRGNYLIGSLAATDFLVSLLVCPFSALMTLQQISPVPLPWNPQWVTCQIFITIDVTCCTASILHLCAIAMDRCKSVTKLRYRTKSRFKKVIPCIVVIWSLAILLSISPHFVFPLINAKNMVPANDNMTGLQEYSGDDIMQNFTISNTVEMQNATTAYDPALTGLNCIVNNNKYYRIVATTIAFYFPLFIIVLIYCRVARIAWHRIHRATGDKLLHKVCNYKEHVVPSTYSEFNSESFQVKLMELEDEKSHHITRKSINNLFPILCQKAAKVCRCGTEMNKDSGSSKSSETSIDLHTQETSTLFCRSCRRASLESFQMSHRSPKQTSRKLLSNNINKLTNRSQNNFNETSILSIDNNNKNKPKLPIIEYNNRSLPKLQITPASEETSTIEGSNLDNPRQVFSTLLHRKADEVECSYKGRSPRNFRKDSITSEIVTKSTLQINRSRSLIANKDAYTRGRAFSINSLAEARTRITLRRERKIIKTMGMVIGGFVICWLPFFLKEIIIPFCDTCYLSPGAEILINWLGYMNSALNPFIYAFSNNDFNQAIRKLFCKSKSFRKSREI